MLLLSVVFVVAAVVVAVLAAVIKTLTTPVLSSNSMGPCVCVRVCVV